MAQPKAQPNSEAFVFPERVETERSARSPHFCAICLIEVDDPTVRHCPAPRQ